MASKDHKCKLKTVKEWEKDLKISLEYDITGDDVTRLRCVICKRWEKRINQYKGFSSKWISPGTSSIKLDSVKAHIATNQHREAVRLEERSKMGALPYFEKVW